MPKIRIDHIGPYIRSDGYIVRPIQSTTHPIGSTPKARHIGGSPRHRVEHEYWYNSNTTTDEYSTLTTDQLTQRWQNAKNQWGIK
jgi:hypothetical protein